MKDTRDMMVKDYDTCTDEELIARLRAGEREITDYLIDKYKSLVRTRARALYLVGGDHEDLIQEGMLGLFKAVRDYKPGKEASFATFAGLCIDRQMYSAVASSQRQKHQPLNSFVSLSEPVSEQELRLVDEENEMLIFTGGHASVPEREGYSLSVRALSDRCTGVSIHGTKYELDNVTVENSFPIGVSNQWQGSAEITVEQGVLAVIESKM